MALVESVLLVSAIIFILYKYGTKNYKRWKDAKLIHDKPYPFVGSDLNIFTKKKSPGDNTKFMYDKHTAR